MVVMSPVWTRRLAAWLLGCALLSACKVDTAPAGGLVLSLETDLAVPKDIDRVQLEITQEGRLIRLDDQPIGSGHMLLPAEIRVPYPGNDKPLLIRATAFHADQPRIEHSAVTPVPRSWLGLVRVPLSYLCDGTALPEGGSSCGEGNTCNQGSCGSSEIPLDALQRYAPDGNGRSQPTAPNAADGGPQANVVGAAPSGCFDVSSCFASAQLLDIDVTTCTAALPPAAASSRISVALTLPLGSSGICDNGACLVPLDLDSGGYSVGDGGDILLPMGVCDKLLQGVPIKAAISSACGQKTSLNPPCGPWSSVQTPVPTLDTTGMNTGEPGSSNAPSLLGGACSGAARQACGMCGTQARECRDGKWDDWGTCLGQGSCKVGDTEACGRGGTRTCGGNCEWGQCLAQTCTGSSSQSCGNCGTQSRTCDNGVWSAWSACEAQGECAPNTTRGCGSSGTQACGGNCRWGSCGNQSCVGAPSEACGDCGTRTRGCDAGSGKWSAFGECADEGACTPDTTRACGSNGNQACRGDCTWDNLCGGQTCTGESTRACGNCGTQTRNCDSNTGRWGDWSPCTGQGECAPNDARSCGSGGTQVCGGNCRWDDACSGQTCTGPARQSCGNCGTQTRTCNSNTGTWSAFSACMNQGACRPGAARGCGSGGSQTCTASCEWPTACGNQECTGPATQECGNCGTQSRTCNPNTGMYGAWSACTGEKTCAPGTKQTCAGTGTQTCGSACEWDATCECPAGQHLCGTMCVSDASPMTCGSACLPCPAGPANSTPTCDGKSCGFSCGALTQCANSCIDTQTDVAHCGGCDNHVCPRGEVCAAGSCECPAGQHRCGPNHVCMAMDATNGCGPQCAECTAPAGAKATCDGKACSFTCTTGMMCTTSNTCANLDTDNNNCGKCDMMCSGGKTCQSAMCQCPTGTHDCSRQCVRDTAPATCGKSCTTPCVAPEGGTVSCDGVSCVPGCPAGTHDCSGSCMPDTSITQCGPKCQTCQGATGATSACEKDACTVKCSKEGQTVCNIPGVAPYCADLLNDYNNCKTCGNVCPGIQQCYSGVCDTPPVQ